LAANPTPTDAANLTAWSGRVGERLGEVVELTVNATVAGSPLRRREAIAAALSAVDRQVRRLTQ